MPLSKVFAVRRKLKGSTQLGITEVTKKSLSGYLRECGDEVVQQYSLKAKGRDNVCKFELAC